MEREDYQKRINDLLDAVSTLLDANKAMGEKLDKATAAYDDLKAEIKRMESRTGSDYPECEQAR
jgi:septation ring formation regulator EzrA